MSSEKTMNKDPRPDMTNCKNEIPRIGQIIEVTEESILPLKETDTKE